MAVRLILTKENSGSNPALGNLKTFTVYYVTRIWKEARIGPTYKRFTVLLPLNLGRLETNFCWKKVWVIGGMRRTSFEYFFHLGRELKNAPTYRPAWISFIFLSSYMAFSYSNLFLTHSLSLSLSLSLTLSCLSSCIYLPRHWALAPSNIFSSSLLSGKWQWW